MAFWCCQAREEEQELVVDDFLFKGKQPEAKLYSDAPSHQESFGSTVDADVTGDADDSTSALSDPSEPPACLQQDIARALQSCRLLEAKELLSRPENDKEIALAARLDVLARQYEDSQRILNTPSEEMTVNDRVKELNFEYGMSLETHGFRLVVNVEWHLDSMEELLRYAALYISKDSLNLHRGCKVHLTLAGGQL
ncbi:unnamed protein product [Effrenium voratum]|uniref:Uncharacterized protein n=1 Tax=Effrenium voratum TaxID=2562239 RepID=A0AA36HZX9_9DINO|nr:unnamed protein product [Effrenium voratum]